MNNTRYRHAIDLVLEMVTPSYARFQFSSDDFNTNMLFFQSQSELQSYLVWKQKFTDEYKADILAKIALGNPMLLAELYQIKCWEELNELLAKKHNRIADIKWRLTNIRFNAKSSEYLDVAIQKIYVWDFTIILNDGTRLDFFATSQYNHDKDVGEFFTFAKRK